MKNNQEKQKNICALTMARNDTFFLTKWIDYYGGQLDKENLYVYLDGEDQVVPENAAGVNVTKRPHKQEEMTVGDRTRIGFLNQEAAKLLQRYDLVIGCDCDEFLVVDPKVGRSLRAYLSGIKVRPSVSGLGLDVGQKIGEEPTLDPTKPFLSQRSYALLDSQYTKPVVISKPVTWGAGFHRVKNHNYRIDKNLYLFHFGSVDISILENKMKDSERLKAGWTKHMLQRRRAIDLAGKKKAKPGDTYLPIAHMLQTIIRHPFAWFRPYMYFWKLIVHIPERFKNSV
jgi:hypothetical protein